MKNMELINFEKVDNHYHILIYDKERYIYNLCIMTMNEPQLTYDQNSQTVYGGLGNTPIVYLNSNPIFNFSAEVIDAKTITFNTLSEYFNYMRNLHE